MRRIYSGRQTLITGGRRPPGGHPLPEAEVDAAAHAGQAQRPPARPPLPAGLPWENDPLRCRTCGGAVRVTMEGTRERRACLPCGWFAQANYRTRQWEIGEVVDEEGGGGGAGE